MDTLSKGMERRIPSSNFYIRPLIRMESNRLRIYESVMFDYFDRHTIISSQDQELVFLEKREQIEVIPNGIDIEYFKPQQKKKEHTLLFNGNMQYEPNVISAIYIAKEILPLVHKTNPDVNLLISGTSPTKEVIALETNKIKISGWLEDIRDAYSSAEIFIAPMQIGTGLQNKLLEAMAMKMPCITSKLANNALKATPDSEILIGNTKEEYANLINHLIENSELKNKIAQNGYSYITSTFNWKKSTFKLNQIIDSTL
jgi:glycosyltransferase involved in cell wall biosynthesis